MFTSVACSCARNGRSLFSTVKNFSRTPNPTGVRDLSLHLSSRLLAPTPWRPTARCVSLSAASRGAKDRPCSLSAPTDRDPPVPDEESFGSLSADMSSRRRFRKDSPYIQDLRHRDDDTEDVAPVEPRIRTGRRNTQYWYFLQCKKLIKENKLQEALDMFSRDMLQGERLQPEEFNYTLLIGGCGRAGQLKKAFRLYNEMKKRGLDATDATYTALFNACAESPSKLAGLEQALKLEQDLRRQNYNLSTITYHALLKAHAVTNHLQACIHTLREMLQNGHLVTQETFHHLLMGCLMDKETGFRLALQVWRQMLSSGIRPDSKNYNLLLRAARDCGIGDPALASRLLLRPEEKHARKRRLSQSEPKVVIDIDRLERQLFIRDCPGDSRDGEDASPRGQDSTHLIPVRQTLPVEAAAERPAPNLLDLFEGGRGGVISIGSVDGAADRLALIGGAEGFLEKMDANGLRPDIRTLTLLADAAAPGPGSLQVLLKAAKQHKVRLDAGFFNCVIRRAARARDQEGARAVLPVMRERGIKVNRQTFGCLALGCERQKDGLQLLKDMEEAGFKPNVQVFSALIGRATRRLDYAYLKTILKTMTSLEVWPNEVIIRQLEFASQYPPNYNQYKSRNNYMVQIDGFRSYYQLWLNRTPAQSAEDEQAALQSEMDAAVMKVEAAARPTESQKDRRAAARRYNKDGKSSAAL